MLTDNPYDSSRNNLPLMRYQITQTHEVLKELYRILAVLLQGTMCTRIRKFPKK